METSELSARCGRDGRAISTVQNYPDLTTIFRDGYGIAIDRGGCAMGPVWEILLKAKIYMLMTETTWKRCKSRRDGS